MSKQNLDDTISEVQQILSKYKQKNPKLFNSTPRDPKRIEGTLAVVSQAWAINPDLRLTQLILNVIPPDTDAYYIEDDKLTESIKKTYLKGKN